MDTKRMQLIGNPHDGKVVDVTADEIRKRESVYLPYKPQDGTYMDVAYAEYVRCVYGMRAGQVMTYINPTLDMGIAEQIIHTILDGERSSDGVWLLQGATADGQLQMSPLSDIQ